MLRKCFPWPQCYLCHKFIPMSYYCLCSTALDAAVRTLCGGYNMSQTPEPIGRALMRSQHPRPGRALITKQSPHEVTPRRALISEEQS
ncbi:unnamed protein product [Arctogadus glacialis]